MSVKTEMESDEIEAVMERAWDLHDKISDAIHSLSKSHFLTSIQKNTAIPPQLNPPSFSAQPHWVKDQPNNNEPNGVGSYTTPQRQQHQHMQNGVPTAQCGDFMEEVDRFAETRSLNAIRNALEMLEDNLQFLHTLQLQQRAERDAALIRLEESRLVLLRKLREHRGRECSVIQEALSFATDRDETVGLHLSPSEFQNSAVGAAHNAVYCDKEERMGEKTGGLENRRQNGLAQFLGLSFQFVNSSGKLHKMVGMVAKVALAAASVLAILRLQRTGQKKTLKHSIHEGLRARKNGGDSKERQMYTNVGDSFPKPPHGERRELPGRLHFKNLDVFFGRG